MAEKRDVVVNDPELSPEANRELTDEVRKAVGAKSVPAPHGRDEPAELPGHTDSRLTAVLSQNRLLIGLSLFVLLLLAIIVAVATGEWIVVGAAAFLHAAVTIVWAVIAIQMASEPEHADPNVAAALEEEGVSDPDARVEELARDFKGESRSGGGITAEETPNVSDSAPSLMIWLPAVGLLVVSAVTPFVTDGRGVWLLPVIIWPLVIGWLAFAWGKPEGLADAVTERPRALAAGVALGVLGIVLVMIGVVTW